MCPLGLEWLQTCMWDVIMKYNYYCFSCFDSFAFYVHLVELVIHCCPNMFFASLKCLHFSHFHFFYLLESSRWSHFSSSGGSPPSSSRCHTKFKYIQSKPYILLKLDGILFLSFFLISFPGTGGRGTSGIFFFQRTPLPLTGESSLSWVDYFGRCWWSIFWLFCGYTCMIPENRKWTCLLW